MLVWSQMAYFITLIFCAKMCYFCKMEKVMRPFDERDNDLLFIIQKLTALLNDDYSNPDHHPRSSKRALTTALDTLVEVYDEIDASRPPMGLKALIKAKSFRLGTLPLASGKSSDYFFDLKPTML